MSGALVFDVDAAGFFESALGLVFDSAARGSEAHNSSFHNWAVTIRPDGSAAEVCYYHDDDDPDGTSTWYLAGGRTVKRDGNCPDQ